MRVHQNKHDIMEYTLHQAYVALKKPRILLADDDTEMRALLSAVLRKDGFDVLEAQDGSTLLDLIGDQILDASDKPGIDLIISDIRMPGVDGLNILAGLRKSDWSTPVLLITAFGDKKTHQEAARLGAVGVFNKPFDLDDFRMAILNLIGPPGPNNRRYH